MFSFVRLAAIALAAFVLDLHWITRSPKRIALPQGAPPSPVRTAAGAS